MPYYRIAIAGPCAEGSASLEWRSRAALEALGHTVFPFCPALQPWLFDDRGDLDAKALRRFLDVQRVDFLLLGQGCLLRHGDEIPATCAVGLLASGTPYAARTAEAVAASKARFTLAVGEMAQRQEGLPNAIAIAAAADAGWVLTPLANTIAQGPAVLCMQDGTEEGVGFMRGLRDVIAPVGIAVRCLGTGWPADLALPSSHDPLTNDVVYALRSGVACVELAGGEPCDDFVHALADAEGVPVVRGSSPEATAHEVVGLASGWRPHALPRQGSGELTLEGELARGLEEARAYLTPGQAPGTDDRRTVVCAMAYVGCGNFGDEYIYQTIDRRLRHARPGSTLVAVSENPQHTLLHRGTYAISQADLALLDHVLVRSSVALVLAGLLFDQGIRWTMGKAETFGYPIHSDIPGITEFVTLAKLNGAQTIFHGIGGGPLEVEGSQRLVTLMGQLGARFLTRDEETTRLVRACPVPDAQATTAADIAFLGDAPHVPSVDAWLADNVPQGNAPLAVSLRDYESNPPDFAERVAGALDGFVEAHPAVTPVFCILDPSDASLSRRVAAAMAHGVDVRAFDPRDDLDALVDLLTRCRLGLSMRYHCSLVLMRSGVPACGIDYLPKVGALYEELGATDALLPADATAGAMGEMLERLEAEHEERSRQVREASAAMTERAAEAERELLAKVDAARGAKAGAIGETFYVRDVPDVDLRQEAELQRIRDEFQGERDRLQAETDDLRRQLAEARDEVQAVRQSTSYRLGNAAVRIFRRG